MLWLVGVRGSVLTHCRCRTSRELWLVPQEITDILRWLDKCRSLRNASKCSRRPLVPRIMEYDPGDSTVSTTGELILAGDFNRASLKINDKQSVHVVIHFTMFFLRYRSLRYYPTCLFCPCSYTFHHVFPGIPLPTLLPDMPVWNVYIQNVRIVHVRLDTHLLMSATLAYNKCTCFNVTDQSVFWSILLVCTLSTYTITHMHLYFNSLCLLRCICDLFIHIKLALLTQFPAWYE